MADLSTDDLQARLSSLQEELLACQRLALLGNLAAMVAHEFNNLMTPVIARAEASLSMDDTAFMRKALERTLVQSQRAIAVTRHLLDMAHDAAAGDDEPASVHAAVTEAIETITRPFEKDGITLELDVPEDLRVKARPELLCQLFMNLLLNARAAMKGLEGELRVSAHANGDFVRIDVCDSGQGIEPDRLEKVVNPFLAADPHENPNDWRETGIGLSVCRMIARHHGARLHATNNDGRGCTFTVCWPSGTPE